MSDHGFDFGDIRIMDAYWAEVGRREKESKPDWLPVAKIERQFGVTFEPAPRTVLLSVAKLSAALWKPPASGEPVSGRVSQPKLDEYKGMPRISKGSALFAYLRDQGAVYLPFSVNCRAARKFQRLYGAEW